MDPFWMKRVAAQSSPFNCAWIPKGSIGTIGGVTYGVCARVRELARTVSEADCLRCPLWQEPPDWQHDRI